MPVFIIGDAGERVPIDSFDMESTEPTFFELHSHRSQWFHNVFKTPASSTKTVKLLRAKIAETFGPKGRKIWKTSKAGDPLGKPGPIDVSVDGADVTVLQDRSVVCMLASVASLNWLSRTIVQELSSAAAPTAVTIQPDDAVHAVIKQPFDSDTIEALKAHDIVWVESKRTLKSSAGVTKVRLNLKKRKSYGDEKFIAYASKVARRSARAAIALTEGTAAVESDGDDSDIEAPDTHQASPSNDSDMTDE